MRGKRFHRLTFVSAFALVVAVAAVFASGAAAKTAYSWACGANPLTSSVTLTSDVTCTSSTGDGIDVGAPGIVINLNGHTISTTGAGSSGSGVDTGGYDRITIENGSIANFDYGIDAYGSSGFPVSGMLFTNLHITFIDGEYGIYASYLHNSSMTKLLIDGSGKDAYGIYAEYSSFLKIDPSVINLGGVSGSIGVYLYETCSSLVASITVNQADSYGFEDYGDAGECGGNTFRGNVSNGVSGDTYGFYVYETYPFDKLVNNYATSGYIGFDLEQDTYGFIIATGNAANNNTDSGFYNYENYLGTTGSTYTGNHSNRNGGTGFDGYYEDFYSYWNMNTANYNDEGGFFLDYPYQATLTWNKASFNNDSGSPFTVHGGFTFDDTSGYMLHQVSHNGSFNNNGWGFWSDTGLVPGGGNKIGGNSFGCFNVTCS